MGSVVLYWKEHSSFQQINQIVSRLEVINDAAERSVQFDSDYNQYLHCKTLHEGDAFAALTNFSKSLMEMMYYRRRN